jgi:hypothetical protein
MTQSKNTKIRPPLSVDFNPKTESKKNLPTHSNGLAHFSSILNPLLNFAGVLFFSKSKNTQTYRTGKLSFNYGYFYCFSFFSFFLQKKKNPTSKTIEYTGGGGIILEFKILFSPYST